jgi:hypothetical protein
MSYLILEFILPVSYPTPYSLKGDKSFWKTAVAELKLGTENFNELHQLSFSKRTTRIASMGSCFAQHVGKWLIHGGFNFKTSQLERQQISSFAFGNIYTPRCFLQWLDLAESNENVSDDSGIAVEKDRFFDLLRPNFNVEGFDSHEALKAARVAATNELKEIIKETDVLVFTLGLVEAWQDKQNITYPSCPGIMSGTFDPKIYKLHVFSYEEVREDVLSICHRLRLINPELKMVLTVSPVPLTATATEKHVLVASQYAKSVLRAVAGFLSDSYGYIDYFPSYEIITAPKAGDFRFQSNLRSVTPEGVSYVMSHFQSAFHNDIKVAAKKTLDDVNSAYHKDEAAPFRHTLICPKALAAEAVCEEELAEATRLLSKKSTSQNTQSKGLTLFGDSHLGKLSTAYTQLGVDHCGGMVMNGSGFAQRKFALCDVEYFVPLESAESRKLWAPILANLQVHESMKLETKSNIISNIGLQTHQTVARLYQWMQAQNSRDINNIKLEDYVDYFNEDQSDQLSILFNLKDAGHNLIVVSDPPFSKYFPEVSDMTNLIFGYIEAMEYIFGQFGVNFFNAVTAFEEDGLDPDVYKSNVSYEDGQHDWIHGNDDYYIWLASKLTKFMQ